LSIQDTGRRQTKHNNATQKPKKMSNTDPTKNPGVSPGSREGCIINPYNFVDIVENEAQNTYFKL